MNKNKLNLVKLRKNHLFLIHNIKKIKIKIDITPIWHFFKKIKAFKHTN